MATTLTAAHIGQLLTGLDEPTYHRGLVDGEESLSHSGMKVLLGATPFHFRHQVDHPEDRQPKKSFDLGSAAHSYQLFGKAVDIAEIRRGAPTDQFPFGDGPAYDDFRTKDAQTKRDLAYAQDLIPILAKDVARIQRMVEALRRHDLAAELLAPDSGTPEVSAFARDPDTGVLLRARIDWLRHDHRIVDFKTAGRLANPEAFARTALDYGYYLQDPTYRHVTGLCGWEATSFDFVIQETAPPYAVCVVHLGEASLELGRRRMRQAIDIYAEAATAGRWPSWPAASIEVDLPYWALRDLDATDSSRTGTDEDPIDHSGIFTFLDSINTQHP